ncbi:hypothetical protein SLS58_007198 [Diplodia intermedia]|uniref:Uncharacterized protein n=1 Tax=Diplodia intermedia TaxID=856260 RepID=A0ABR3TL06_9PEZI
MAATDTIFDTGPIDPMLLIELVQAELELRVLNEEISDLEDKLRKGKENVNRLLREGRELFAGKNLFHPTHHTDDQPGLPDDPRMTDPSTTPSTSKEDNSAVVSDATDLVG